MRVGRFSWLEDGRYAFAYEPSAASLEGFFPLAEFPEFKRIYVSQSLPAFFANRVMSQERADYEHYRKWLGLGVGEDTPFEVLARTGGGRATDTFHLVDEPRPDGRGMLVRFFVSGISHVNEAMDRLGRVSLGDQLEIRPEPDNPIDPRALLVDVANNQPVGWIPSWLLDEVHSRIEEGAEIRIEVEQINIDAPDHLKLMARITTS